MPQRKATAGFARVFQNAKRCREGDQHFSVSSALTGNGYAATGLWTQVSHIQILEYSAYDILPQVQQARVIRGDTRLVDTTNHMRGQSIGM